MEKWYKVKNREHIEIILEFIRKKLEEKHPYFFGAELINYNNCTDYNRTRYLRTARKDYGLQYEIPEKSKSKYNILSDIQDIETIERIIKKGKYKVYELSPLKQLKMPLQSI